MIDIEIKKKLKGADNDSWNKNIILIGGGGHAKSCIEIIESLDEFKIYGLIDNSIKNESILGYPILGSDEQLQKIKNELGAASALITVGHIKTNTLRKELFQKIRKFGFDTPLISSKSAYVSKHSKVGSGTIIMNSSIINADAVIGENCILNNKSLIEHDAVIGNHCHIATGAIINGGATVGKNSFIGSGTVLKQGITIGSNCLISAGLFINHDVPDGKIIT